MDVLGLPDWVIWGLIAALLLVLEMVTFAYLALGFSVAAAGVALVVLVFPGMAMAVQALIWAATGLAVWLALSRWNQSRRGLRADINDFDSLASLPRADRERLEAQRRAEALRRRDDPPTGPGAGL